MKKICKLHVEVGELVSKEISHFRASWYRLRKRKKFINKQKSVPYVLGNINVACRALSRCKHLKALADAYRPKSENCKCTECDASLSKEQIGIREKHMIQDKCQETIQMEQQPVHDR